MSSSLYEISIPLITRMLGNFRHVLEKGEAWAMEKNMSEADFLQGQLAPDMFNLVKQVQIATDISRRGVSRLAGIEPAAIDDNEKSFADLYSRIDSTIEFLRGIKPDQVDGNENRAISLEAGGHKLNFDGRSMLLYFTLPNLFFHITTGYNILRHKGVPLGKLDYLGKPT